MNGAYLSLHPDRGIGAYRRYQAVTEKEAAGQAAGSSKAAGQEAKEPNAANTDTAGTNIGGRYDTVEISGEAQAYREQKLKESMAALREELVGKPKSEREGGDPFFEVDPDGSIYRREYWTAYIGALEETVKHIEDYYADARAENSKLGASDFMMYLRGKYLADDSGFFRSDMSAAERSMAYKQEMALYFGGKITTLKDPYALAAHGGLRNVFDLEKQAKKAAEDYLADLVKERRKETVSEE